MCLSDTCRLYWCTQDHVEAMNFDGSNRTAVFTIPGRNFFELTYYNVSRKRSLVDVDLG